MSSESTKGISKYFPYKSSSNKFSKLIAAESLFWFSVRTAIK